MPDNTEDEELETCGACGKQFDYEDTEVTGIERAKWTIDGAKTLSEAAEKAREFADYLDDKARQGWQLTGPVEDDYGFTHHCKAAA